MPVIIRNFTSGGQKSQKPSFVSHLHFQGIKTSGFIKKSVLVY